MRKISLAVLVALVAGGCGFDAPSTSPSAPPTPGAPARIELSATSGTGATGGSATITARVQDAYSATVPGVMVTFSSIGGTLSATSVQTDETGVARSTLTADPGTVKVRAAAGSVTSPETSVTVQPHTEPFVPPPGSPPPLPFDPTLPPPPPPSYSVSIVASPTSVVTGTPTTLTATVTPLAGAPAVTSAIWDCDTSSPATDLGTLTSAQCIYSTAGTYTAKLTVTGGTVTGSATTTVTVTATPPPSYTVSVSASPATIAAGDSTRLTASVTRVNGAPPPNSWTWDCDSSTPPTNSTSAVSTLCQYATSGIFIAKVTVSNGSVTGSATVDVNVTAPAPAGLTVAIDPVTATVGAAATITARVSSAGAVPTNSLTWEWDFDSTATSTFTTTETGPSPHSTTQTYSSTGTKTIKVRVTDPLTARTATGTRVITVSP